jgi:hypothetical protein
MLARVEDQAVVEIGPGLADALAALKDDVLDSPPRQLAGRREPGRPRADDDGATAA